MLYEQTNPVCTKLVSQPIAPVAVTPGNMDRHIYRVNFKTLQTLQLTCTYAPLQGEIVAPKAREITAANN